MIYLTLQSLPNLNLISQFFKFDFIDVHKRTGLTDTLNGGRINSQRVSSTVINHIHFSNHFTFE